MGGRSTILALAAALALTGCTTSAKDLPVRTEYSKTTAFHEWRTYRFTSAEPKGPTGTQYPRYDQMIRKALVDELTARGFTRIDDGSPDFRVSYELVFRGEDGPQSVPKGGGADPMGRSYGGPAPSGSLTVSMLDPKTGETLWSGHLADLKMTAIEPQKQLDSAIWRILVDFPPITG